MLTIANSGKENTSSNKSESGHLQELSGSDYEIKDGEPDIKGWDVKNEHGQKLGDVSELLFDPQSRKVRYIVLDLSDNELGVDIDRRVLVPIGVAKIYNIAGKLYGTPQSNPGIDPQLTDEQVVNHPDEDMEALYHAGEISYHPTYDSEVVIVAADWALVSALPAYEKGLVLPENEIAIRRIFESGNAIDSTGFNRHIFYEHTHFDERGYFDRGTAAKQSNPENNQTPEPEAD